MLTRDTHVVELVDAFLHGLLSDSDARILEEHCAKCRICETALEEGRKRLTAVRSVAPCEASEELIRATIEQVSVTAERRQRRGRRLRSTVFWVTAASVLLLAGIHVYFQRMAPSPYDVVVMGQDSWMAGSSAGLRVSVVDHRTGEPVDGVPVEIRLRDPSATRSVTLASFRTGDNSAGAGRFRLPDWEDGRYELQVTARPGGETETIVEDVELRRSWKLMLSTDKPIYQPGQTIHLRALALRQPDLEPVTGEEVVFEVRDPKGNLILRRHDVATNFGMTSADCRLASEILEGTYEITCHVGDTSSVRTVEVFRYVLPKFRLSATTDRDYYGPGEEVKVNVQADYFFGQPVASGGVTLQVHASGIPVQTIEGSTDESGAAEFVFRLPDMLVGQEQHDGMAPLQITAVVTDTAGQRHGTTVTRLVSADPLQLDVVAEAGTLVPGVVNRIHVMVTYPDGEPAEVRLIVQERGEELRTNRFGIATLEVVPPAEGMDLTLKAIDDEGRTVQETRRLESSRSSSDFLVRTDEAVYDGGATMTIQVHGSGSEPVFVDLVKQGQTLLTQTVRVSEGRGTGAIDLPVDVFGTVELVAYRFGREGLPVRKRKTVFIRPAQQVRISASMGEETFRPGEEAQITFTLTDEDGNPLPGAVSLAVVDEAVYHVLRQATGSAENFFLLEQELLEPVLTLYDGFFQPGDTLPVPARREWEQAVFARTAENEAGAGALPISPRSAESRGTSGDDLFSLAVHTFPEKVIRVSESRRQGIAAVVAGWYCLAGALFVVGVTVFAVYYTRLFLIGLAVLAALGMVGGLVAVGMYFGATSAGVAEDAAATAALGMEAPMDGAMAGEQFDEEWDAAGMEPLMNAAPVPDVRSETAAEGSSGPVDSDVTAPPRVRRWFPETLLWRPELITDEQGRATLTLPLADSITTWRMAATAVGGSGQLGSAEFPIRVFQPFFVDLDLPVALTRHDQVSVPLVVYNYLDERQSVTLTLESGDWFERLDDGEAERVIELAPREVRSLRIPIRVLRAGRHAFRVTARASGMSDAVERSIEVEPDGRRVEETRGGRLPGGRVAAVEQFQIPDHAIEGSLRGTLRIYPSTFSELVEGLDAVFQMPYGCFEQTSSTTYPNVLALDYLLRTETTHPEIEQKARQYIHLGYQRLISFEVPGGGFDWFGNPPANRTLTAYGLLEFTDMARVHDVDPALLARTRQWLLAQRRGDGSWPSDAGMLNDGLAGSVQRGNDLVLAATAYIAWAVFQDPSVRDLAPPTLAFLLQREPATLQDPYMIALIMNAVSVMAPGHPSLLEYAQRLAEMKETSLDGEQVYWKQPEGSRTTFYGSGQSGAVETTAMVALALMATDQRPQDVSGALAWLIEQKDARGTWHSTQATVLALKALIEGTEQVLGDDETRTIQVLVDGQPIHTLEIPADQADVVQQVDLTPWIHAGSVNVQLVQENEAATSYQLVVRHHVPYSSQDTSAPAGNGLSIELVYDRERLAVDDHVTVTATVRNASPTVAPMIIADLPIPGGFAIEPGELDELVGSQQIAKYQITPRQAIVYLRELAPNETLVLRYRLRATMPVRVATPAATVYEYYDPARRGTSAPTELEVVGEEG